MLRMGFISYFRDLFELRRFSEGKIGRSDVFSIILLLVLYMLQGIPMGLQSTIPIMLNDRTSYTNIGILSLVTFPFSIKLLWAPILDFFYSERVGKRKSWIIPAQAICGFLLLYGSFGGRINEWIFPKEIPSVSGVAEKGKVGEIQIVKIFVFFLVLYFLLATQDIAVDGWALTILKPEMRVYASACNSAGQSFGQNLAFFLVLSSNSVFRLICAFLPNLSFCSKLKEASCACHKCTDPVISIAGFMRFFGIFILILTFLLTFKREGKAQTSTELGGFEDLEMGEMGVGYFKIWNSYRVLKKVMGLEPIRALAFLLLTKYLFFCAERPIDLKMLSYGLSQDLFAIAKSSTIVVDILFPLIISYYILIYGISNILYTGLVLRLGSLIISTVFLIITKYYYKHEHGLGGKLIYLLLLSLVEVARRVGQLLNSVTDVAFFNKVSDPKIGAIYMTLLNTLANFGNFYPNYVALVLMDWLTSEKYKIDGVYIEALVCILTGIWFIPRMRLLIKRLESYSIQQWNISSYLS